ERGVDRVREMAAAGRVDDELLTPGMIALRDEPHVEQRPAEQNPRQVRVENRADLELEAAEGLAEDAHFREPVRARERAECAERRADTGAEEQRRAAERDVDRAARDGARRRAGERELG